MVEEKGDLYECGRIQNQSLMWFYSQMFIYMPIVYICVFYKSHLSKCGLKYFCIGWAIIALNSLYSKSCLVDSFKSKFNTSALSTGAYSAAPPSAPLNAVIPLKRHRISVSLNNGRLVGPSISASSGQR